MLSLFPGTVRMAQPPNATIPTNQAIGTHPPSTQPIAGILLRMKRPSDDELRHAASAAKLLAEGGDVPRAELAAAARAVCAQIACAHPGGTLELRVPPYAAVQAGIGLRGDHTRGTPPNVVETDAPTLLALASGRLSWPDALATHRVLASGVHTGIDDWFPCLPD